MAIIMAIVGFWIIYTIICVGGAILCKIGEGICYLFGADSNNKIVSIGNTEVAYKKRIPEGIMYRSKVDGRLM